MKCQYVKCAKEFTPTNRRGPAPKYCSARCKQAQYRADKQSEPATRPPRPQPKKPKPVTRPLRPDPDCTPYDSSGVAEMLQSQVDSWTKSEAKYRAMGAPYKFLADMYKTLTDESVL